jgi:hypothetical protein
MRTIRRAMVAFAIAVPLTLGGAGIASANDYNGRGYGGYGADGVSWSESSSSAGPDGAYSEYTASGANDGATYYQHESNGANADGAYSNNVNSSAGGHYYDDGYTDEEYTEDEYDYTEGGLLTGLLGGIGL